MPLLEIRDQGRWDGFVAARPWSQFTQSWAWGEFQRSRGKEVRRFFFHDESGSVLLACQLIRERRRLADYWFAPRGPVFSDDASRDVRVLMREFLQALSVRRELGRPLFLRVEPLLELARGAGALPRRLLRTHAMNPANTLLLDLEPAESDLLAAMHEKTRYNIRVAERDGVRVRLGQGRDDLNTFLRLAEETAIRDRFLSHGADYLRATYEALAPSGQARLRLAEHEGRVLAANLEIGFGDTVTYLHGASSSEARNVMAPYALHWHAIRSAKREGARRYDFWGCNPEWKGNFYYKPSWEGITRFKRGWGGREVNLLGTWDLPTNRLLYLLAFPQSLHRG